MVVAVLAGRHLCAQLAHQAGFVGHEPALGDLAVGQPEHRHLLELEFLAGRRDAQEIALVGAADPEDHADPVALRDHALDHVGAVGKGRAQVRARIGEVLVLRVLRQVLDAGAQPLGARRRELALDRGLVLGALRFLEAANHVLVALEIGGRRLRGQPSRVCGGQRQSRHRSCRSTACGGSTWCVSSKEHGTKVASKIAGNIVPARRAAHNASRAGSGSAAHAGRLPPGHDAQTDAGKSGALPVRHNASVSKRGYQNLGSPHETGLHCRPDAGAARKARQPPDGAGLPRQPGMASASRSEANVLRQPSCLHPERGFACHRRNLPARGRCRHGQARRHHPHRLLRSALGRHASGLPQGRGARRRGHVLRQCRPHRRDAAHRRDAVRAALARGRHDGRVPGRLVADHRRRREQAAALRHRATLDQDAGSAQRAPISAFFPPRKAPPTSSRTSPRRPG